MCSKEGSRQSFELITVAGARTNTCFKLHPVKPQQQYFDNKSPVTLRFFEFRL